MFPRCLRVGSSLTDMLRLCRGSFSRRHTLHAACASPQEHQRLFSEHSYIRSTYIRMYIRRHTPYDEFIRGASRQPCFVVSYVASFFCSSNAKKDAQPVSIWIGELEADFCFSLLSAACSITWEREVSDVARLFCLFVPGIVLFVSRSGQLHVAVRRPSLCSNHGRSGKKASNLVFFLVEGAEPLVSRQTINTPGAARWFCLSRYSSMLHWRR